VDEKKSAASCDRIKTDSLGTFRCYCEDIGYSILGNHGHFRVKIKKGKREKKEDEG
jgi:hypothetical protein